MSATKLAEKDELAALEPYLGHLNTLPFIKHSRLVKERGKSILEIKTPASTIKLTIIIKQTNLSRLLLEPLMSQVAQNTEHPWILFAKHIGRPLGRELQTLGINYLDYAGNCYLRINEHYIAIVEGRPLVHQPLAGRGLGASGYKICFALLAQPSLIKSPVRKMGHLTHVSKTAAATTIAKLVQEGLIDTESSQGRLLEPKVLLDRWLAGYANHVRPKLYLGSFRTRDKNSIRREKRIESTLNSIPDLIWGWSGDAAASRITGQYRGDQSLLCIDPHLPDLPRQLNALSADNGPLIILRSPGPIAFQGVKPHTMHPLLIYTELLLTGDARAKEAAQMIWDEYLGYLK